MGVGSGGCLGEGGEPTTPADGPPTTVRRTETAGAETRSGANEFGYETTVTGGIAVPLVPVADAIQWYRDDEALFADARGPSSYDKAHVTDAVLSPAPDGQGGEDPVEERSTDTRIVTYCGCPHHLSSMRAASLIADGYAHTYALDEGFYGWADAGYPVEGSAVETEPPQYSITGLLSDAGSDARVWAWHDPSGQREVTPVQGDGSFALTLHFYDVTPESPIRLVAPSVEVTRPLEELTDTTVTL
jgi:rhodanese-related sulfurtransferase